jgi:glycerophosphoryl diester phosphodiesterase
MTEVHSQSPFVVAHRAGNDLARLRAAEARGVTVVEADVRLSGRRVDIRHGRRLGRLPVVYDEGRLSRERQRFTLDDLLAEASPRTGLLLDLKGRDIRLAERVLAALEPHLGRRPLAVCARAWRLLEPFGGDPRLRVVPSIGSQRELAAFLTRSSSPPASAVSVRDSLVDPPTVRTLRRRAGAVVCWTVNCGRRAAELTSWGVDGITTDAVDGVASAVRAGAAGSSFVFGRTDAEDAVVAVPRLASPVAVAGRDVEAAVGPELGRAQPSHALEQRLGLADALAVEREPQEALAA